MRRGTIFITQAQAHGLRETVRPFSMPAPGPVDQVVQLLLHEKILFVLFGFDTQPADSKVETLPLELCREDVMIISQSVSMQDGDWARDVLRQARRALYELKTGVQPGWPEVTEKIFDGQQQASIEREEEQQ